MNTDKAYAERIASEYAPKQASKLTALRKLDARAKRPANIFGYTFGIVSALLLGVGMCLTMGVIGAESTALFVVGIIVGVIGIVGCCVNYPIYRRLLEKGKQKYAYDITTLARQICD